MRPDRSQRTRRPRADSPRCLNAAARRVVALFIAMFAAEGVLYAATPWVMQGPAGATCCVPRSQARVRSCRRGRACVLVCVCLRAGARVRGV